MNVTFIQLYHHPEKVSSYYLFDDLMAEVRKRGGTVNVITPNPVRGIDPQTREIYKKKQTETEFEGQTIHRVNVPFDTQSGRKKRAIRYLFASMRCAAKLKSMKTDCVFVQSDPPILYAHFISLVAKRKKVPIIYNIQDLAPDNLIAERDGKTGWILKLLDKIHIRAMKRMTYVVAISKDIRNRLMEKGIPEEKIIVIHNWANEINRDCQREIINKKPKQDVFFEVVYAGNIGYVQNVELLLKAAKRLEHVPEIRISIIGEGILKSKIEEEIKKQALSNVMLRPKLALDEAHTAYENADVNLIPLKKGIIHTAMPSKTANCLLAKKPIIACVDKTSEYASMIEKNGVGIVVDPEDDAGLAEAIHRIHFQSSVFLSFGYDRLHDELFDKQKNVNRYVDLMEAMISKD